MQMALRELKQAANSIVFGNCYIFSCDSVGINTRLFVYLFVCLFVLFVCLFVEKDKDFQTLT